jgi:FSR family fosmidomycin resistance protein-like MFS transporter
MSNAVETTATASSAPHRGGTGIWTGLLAVAIGHLAVDLCTGIWPVYKTMAGLDLAKAGLIATAGSLLGNGLQPVFGVLADRGWRKALLVSGLLLAGAVTWVPYVESYSVLFLLVLLTSVGSAAFHPSGTGAAGTLSERRTGVMVAVFLTGGYLGYGLSQLAFTATYHASRGKTGVLFLVPLLTGLAVAAMVPRVAGRGLSLAEWKRALRAEIVPLRILFLVQLFASAINLGLVFLLPDLLLARGAPTWIAQGGGHAALVLGGALSLLPAGHAADRFGARRVLVVTNFAAGALVAWLVFVPSHSLVELVVVAGFGAFNGANNVVLVAEGNRLFPGQASAASALLMGFPWCFASLAPVIVGHLADPARAGNPATALGWLSLCVPCTLVVSALVPRRKHPSETTLGSPRE